MVGTSQCNHLTISTEFLLQIQKQQQDRHDTGKYPKLQNRKHRQYKEWKTKNKNVEAH